MVDSREQFEKWARDWFASEDVPVEFDPTEECYQHLAAHSAWIAWQASRDAAIEECAVKVEGSKRAFRNGLLCEMVAEQLRALKGKE
jgi:hypothetical protein